MDDDHAIRLRAFAWLDGLQRTRRDPVFTWDEMTSGFCVDGERITLMGAKGIWKPLRLELPISVTTAPPRAGRPAPYEDMELGDGTIRYHYREGSIDQPDNAGLRKLARDQRPLIYFVGIEKSVYCAFWPTYISHDDPVTRTVRLQVDTAIRAPTIANTVGEGVEARRSYITSACLIRRHQIAFRRSVLRAYLGACAMCALKRENLLDAAHIVGDKEERGEPVVRNGLALCKIHHAAFDSHLVGVDADSIIHVRQDVLDEEDGPMLRHGLQELNGERLRIVPRQPTHRPDRDLLALRFEAFRKAT